MTEKLRSCPFCGGEAKIDICNDGSGGIYCSKCDFTPLIQAHFNSQNDRQAAIDWWNTRAEDENPALTLNEVKAISKDMENRQWVWIEILPSYKQPNRTFIIESAYYQAQGDYTRGKAFCCGYPGLGFHFEYEHYGKTWLAYRRKPEGEEVKE